MLTFDGFALSEPGRGTDVNEDFALMDPRAGLFVVADGMGGRPGGETASRRAVEAFARLTAGTGRGRADHAALRRVADEVNRAVRSLGEADPALAGVGTTLSALLLDGSGGALVHVGDSRIFRWRDGALRQLTSDHTVEAEYRREASGAALPLNPRVGSMLARAIGTRETVDPEILELDVRDGDVLLLLTDGVSKVLEPDTLEAWLRAGDRGESAEAMCARLFEAVRAGRTDDDATLGVVTVRAAGAPGSGSQ